MYHRCKALVGNPQACNDPAPLPVGCGSARDGEYLRVREAGKRLSAKHLETPLILTLLSGRVVDEADEPKPVFQSVDSLDSVAVVGKNQQRLQCSSAQEFFSTVAG